MTARNRALRGRPSRGQRCSRGRAPGGGQGPHRTPPALPRPPNCPVPLNQPVRRAGGSGPAAGGRSAPGPALPRRRWGLSRDPPGACWPGAPGPVAPLPGRLPAPGASCVDSRGGGSKTGPVFPPSEGTRSFSELLAPGPVLRAPRTGSPRFPAWGGGHGAGWGETGRSQTNQTEKESYSGGEGGIPDGKNKGVNPGKGGLRMPPAPGPGR